CGGRWIETNRLVAVGKDDSLHSLFRLGLGLLGRFSGDDARHLDFHDLWRTFDDACLHNRLGNHARHLGALGRRAAAGSKQDDDGRDQESSDVSPNHLFLLTSYHHTGFTLQQTLASRPHATEPFTVWIDKV